MATEQASFPTFLTLMHVPVSQMCIADCNKKCQLDGWKNCNHKETCKVHTDNRYVKNPQIDIAEPVPTCLKSCRWLSEDDLNVAMDRRVELFLAELQRWGKTNAKDKGGSGRTEVNVHLQASVVWSYFSSHRRRRLGKAKPSSTFWCSGGSGSISDEAKNKVLGIKSHGSFEIAKQFEVKFFRVTYGCGLMCFSDQGFRESDEVKKWIELDVGSSLLTPDCQHSMADAFSQHGSNARDG